MKHLSHISHIYVRCIFINDGGDDASADEIDWDKSKTELTVSLNTSPLYVLVSAGTAADIASSYALMSLASDMSSVHIFTVADDGGVSGVEVGSSTVDSTGSSKSSASSPYVWISGEVGSSTESTGFSTSSAT